MKKLRFLVAMATVSVSLFCGMTSVNGQNFYDPPIGKNELSIRNWLTEKYPGEEIKERVSKSGTFKLITLDAKDGSASYITTSAKRRDCVLGWTRGFLHLLCWEYICILKDLWMKGKPSVPEKIHGKLTNGEFALLCGSIMMTKNPAAEFGPLLKGANKMNVKDTIIGNYYLYKNDVPRPTVATYVPETDAPTILPYPLYEEDLIKLGFKPVCLSKWVNKHLFVRKVEEGRFWVSGKEIAGYNTDKHIVW